MPLSGLGLSVMGLRLLLQEIRLHFEQGQSTSVSVGKFLCNTRTHTRKPYLTKLLRVGLGLGLGVRVLFLTGC